MPMKEIVGLKVGALDFQPLFFNLTLKDSPVPSLIVSIT